MHQSRRLVCAVSTVLLSLVACVPEPVGPIDPVQPQFAYQADAVVLDEDDLDQLESYDPTTGLLRTTPALAARLDVGSIISTPSGPAPGSGLVARVLAKVPSGGTVDIATEPASIGQLLARGTRSTDMSPTLDDLDSVDAAGGNSALRSQLDGQRSFCGDAAGLNMCLELDSFNLVFNDTVAVGSDASLDHAVGVDRLSGRIRISGVAVDATGVLNLVTPTSAVTKAVSRFGFSAEVKVGISYHVQAGVPVDITVPFEDARFLLSFDCRAVCLPDVVTSSGLPENAFTDVLGNLRTRLVTTSSAKGAAMFGLGATIGLTRSTDKVCGATSRLFGADAFLRAGVRGQYDEDAAVPLAAGWFSEFEVSSTSSLTSGSECRLSTLLGRSAALGDAPAFRHQEAPVWLTPRVQLNNRLGGDPDGQTFLKDAVFESTLGGTPMIGLAQLDGQWPPDDVKLYPASVADQPVQVSADRETGAALSVTLGTVRTGNSGVASLTGVPMPPAGEWRLRAAGPDDDGNPVGGVFTVHDPDNPPVQGIGLGEWRGSYSLSASPSNCTTTREESGASYTQVRCTSISINDSLQIDEDGLAEWSYLATGSSRAVTTYDVSGRTCQWQTTWEMTADPAGFLSASFVVRQSLPDENGIPQTEGNAEFDGANIRYTYHSISSCSTDAEDGRLPQESHMSGEFLRGRHAISS